MLGEGAHSRHPSPQDLPGNYFFFELFIEISVGGVSYLGYPKQAIRDLGCTPPVLRWASPIKLAYPDPAVPRLPWIDDPITGLLQRTINSPEDVLGSEGLVGGRKYRFEKILQETKGQIVYSLFNDASKTRIAYAFSREMFRDRG